MKFYNEHITIYVCVCARIHMCMRVCMRTQIFISFAPKTFITAVSHFQDTISEPSSWMTYNLPSLNPYKTEFMLIGHTQQYPKSPTLLSAFLQITI